MGDVISAAIAQQEARKIAFQAAEAKAATVAETVATGVASVVAERTANRRLPADVAAFLRANPPAPGEPGAPGVNGEPGVVWRGPWSHVEDYAPGDAVEDGGSSYVATSPSHGSRPPSSSWDLLAKKGDKGEPGKPGKPGIVHSGGSGGGWGGTGVTPGSSGSSLPSGGTPGQVVTNTAPGTGDWQDPGASLPPGGTTGEVLTKLSDAEGDAGWEPAAGSVGPTGPAGPAGTKWWIGSGLPDDAVGVDDDLYLNVTNGDIYQRVGGTWGA
jgi:hypothetical protein